MWDNLDPPPLTDQSQEKGHHDLDSGQENENKPLKVILQIQMPPQKGEVMGKVYTPSPNFLQTFGIQTFIKCPIQYSKQIESYSFSESYYQKVLNQLSPDSTSSVDSWQKFYKQISQVGAGKCSTVKLRNQKPKIKIKLSHYTTELFDLVQILPTNREKITHTGEGH